MRGGGRNGSAGYLGQAWGGQPGVWGGRGTGGRSVWRGGGGHGCMCMCACVFAPHCSLTHPMSRGIKTWLAPPPPSFPGRDRMGWPSALRTPRASCAAPRCAGQPAQGACGLPCPTGRFPQHTHTHQIQASTLCGKSSLHGLLFDDGLPTLHGPLFDGVPKSCSHGHIAEG